MRILIDLTALADNFSGIERFAMSITQEMIRQTEHDFILIFKNEVHKEFRNTPPNVQKFLIYGKSKLITAQMLLPVCLWKHRADRYFFPAFPAPFLFFSPHAVSTIHDLSCWDCPATDKKWMNWYYRILYKKAALCGKKIVTVSAFSKSRIVDKLHVKPQKVCVAYNGLSELFLDGRFNTREQEKIREKYQLPSHYILCLSTIEPRKNMRLLIDAFAQLWAEGAIQSDLVLAGRKGWMVDHILDGLPASVLEHIRFTGFVDNEDLPYLYRNADYFVFPSIYEGFGIPPLEAISQDSLVISSRVSSMPEVLGDAALYFENNNLADLKRCMLELEQMPEEAQMAQRAKGQAIARRYRWDASAAQILNFLTSEHS